MANTAPIQGPLYFIGLDGTKPVYLDIGTGAFLTDPRPRDRFTLPSAITMAGYACALAAIAGLGPWWLGFVSLVADEVDGRLARSTGEVTRYGGELDYAVDMTLTGLTAVKALGAYGLAILPFVTAAQAWMRANNDRPSFGSARAVFTLIPYLRRMR